MKQKGEGRTGEMINCVSGIGNNEISARKNMKFQIICDSSADLLKEDAQRDQVRVVPFYVSMDGEHYLKEGEEIPVAEFYQTMIDHADCFPKTSMPSIQDYVDAFEPFVEQEIPVLCICLTKKFSGSYQSAVNAKLLLEEEHGDVQIYVMDSQLVTALQGLLVKEAVRLRDHGLTLEEAIPLLEEIRSTGQIFFTTKDLKYLEHGGRLGKAASIAGTMLNLKPLLRFYGGELGPTEICRGRKKSLEKVTEKFFDFLKENHIDLSGYWFGTGIGAEIAEYDAFQKMLQKRFDEEGIQPAGWLRVRIGATIGVHTGPYPIGLGILKRCDIS